MALLAVLGAQGIWLVIVAGRAETGWDQIVRPWRDAALGWALGELEPIHLRTPADQAKFWLAEVDRVLAGRERNARLTAGAALMLDGPSVESLTRYLDSRVPQGPVGFPILDREEAKRGSAQFEDRCRTRCLALAERATQLEPTNVLWWRLRAMLLWNRNILGADGRLRTADWLAILDQCSRHDPDNALYDYLAAYHNWRISAEWDVAANRLRIHDRKVFDQGVARFERGLSRPQCMVGDTHYAVATDFLQHTSLSRDDQRRLVYGRTIAQRRDYLLAELVRWQFRRAEQFERAKDLASTFIESEKSLRVLDQFNAPGEAIEFNRTWRFLYRMQLAHLDSQGQRDSRVTTPERIGYLRELQRRALLDEQAINHAVRKLAATSPGRFMPTPPVPPLAAAAAMFVAVAPVVLRGLAGAALVATLFGLWEPAVGAPHVSAWLHVGLLAMATLVSFVVFGLCPARIVPSSLQRGVAVLSMLGGGFAYVLVKARGRQVRFSLRALLIGVFIAAVALALRRQIGSGLQALAAWTEHLRVPPRDTGSVEVEALRNLIVLRINRWLLATLQWLAYHGVWIAIALWTTLAAWLSAHRSAAMALQQGIAPPGWARRFAAGVATVRKPAAVALLVLLVPYLFIATWKVGQFERQFQEQIAFARDPQAHWAMLRRETQAVRADRNLMKQLEATLGPATNP